MDIYEALGVRTVVNAAGTVTRFGGSLMAPEVLESMRQASQQFCLLHELHEQVGLRIAAVLEVEAAYVTASASSGMVLTTAACMAGANPDWIEQLPDTTGMRHEVIIQKRHRIDYDQAIRLAGAKLVVVDDDGTPPTAAVAAAINENTAAIFVTADALPHPASVPLDQVVTMARAASVPVIVDAASECPPVSTLTHFWRAGADLVIFSGGKSIMGPQSTGLIIGRRDLVAACAANGNPFAAVGRPMKVSREEVVAFMKALELYLARDHQADAQRWQAQVDFIRSELQGISGVAITRFAKGETYAVPMLAITPGDGAGFSRDAVADALLDGQPRIVVARHFTDDSIVINPHMLAPGQERIVARRCREVLTQIG